jgi:hypothetical protein
MKKPLLGEAYFMSTFITSAVYNFGDVPLILSSVQLSKYGFAVLS